MNQFKLSEDKKSIKASISGESFTIEKILYRKSGGYKVVKPHRLNKLVKYLNSHAWFIKSHRSYSRSGYPKYYRAVHCSCNSKFINIGLPSRRETLSVDAILCIQGRPNGKKIKCTMSKEKSNLIKKEQVVKSVLL